MKKKIVVFAANECVKEKEEYYYSLAYETGKLLAENNFITVTGGGPGLMNQVMKGAYENGGKTIGICLANPKIMHSVYVSEKFMYENLNKRQEKLLGMADGFLVLPGGVGTFYEIFAVLALKRKQELDKNKPMIFVDGYYNDFEILMGKMYKEGFAQKEIKSFYERVDTPEEAVRLLQSITKSQVVIPAKAGIYMDPASSAG